MLVDCVIAREYALFTYELLPYSQEILNLFMRVVGAPVWVINLLFFFGRTCWAGVQPIQNKFLIIVVSIHDISIFIHIYTAKFESLKL